MKYAKAIAAFVLAFLAALWQELAIPLPTLLNAVIAAAVAAGGVWAVPNRERAPRVPEKRLAVDGDNGQSAVNLIIGVLLVLILVFVLLRIAG